MFYLLNRTRTKIVWARRWLINRNTFCGSVSFLFTVVSACFTSFCHYELCFGTRRGHCESFKVRRSAQNERCGLLVKGIILLCYNAHPPIANGTQYLIVSFYLMQLNHTLCNVDLVPSYYHLFLHLTKAYG